MTPRTFLTNHPLVRVVATRLIARLVAYGSTAGVGFLAGLDATAQAGLVGTVVGLLESFAARDRKRRRRENIRTRPGLVPPPENVAEGPMPTRVHNLPPVDTARRDIV